MPELPPSSEPSGSFLLIFSPSFWQPLVPSPLYTMLVNLRRTPYKSGPTVIVNAACFSSAKPAIENPAHKRSTEAEEARRTGIILSGCNPAETGLIQPKNWLWCKLD